MTAGKKNSTRPSRRAARPKQVYEQLRELIVLGRLAPGSRLVETDIASRFNVSRTPVRGALQRLQQEGYIIDSPAMRQSRPTVAPLTGEDAYELFNIVGQLEALAAASAADLPATQRQALAKELTVINNDFRKAAQASRPDHNRLWDLDERFHNRTVEVAGGPRLQLLHSSVKPQAERYERLYVSYLTGEIATSAAEHKAIINAIATGNGEAAKEAVEINWRNAADRLGRVIERVGDRGRW